MCFYAKSENVWMLEKEKRCALFASSNLTSLMSGVKIERNWSNFTLFRFYKMFFHMF
jgi:hypothetical protein